MKVFISQPMRGKTDDEIKEERAAAEGLVRGKFRGDVEVIDSFIDGAPKTKHKAVYYLGRSIQLLADADMIVCLKGWEDARGCRIEKAIATEYGIPALLAPEP